jgi:hypothetical protein
MADLTIAAADVAPVKTVEQLTGPAGEAIDAGEVVRFDVSTGYFTLANAATAPEARAVGIAVNSGIVNQTITVMVKGLLDVGDALASETYDEILELSDTDGKIDDTAGGTVAKAVGRVVGAFGATTADKILYVDFPMASV